MKKSLLSWKTQKISNLLALILFFIAYDAMASKGDVTLTPKRVVYQYNEIEDTLGSITPKLTLQGFIFKEINLSFKEECTQYESFFFRMAALNLRHDEKKKQEVLDLLNRCPNANNIFFRTLLQIGKKDLLSEKELQSFLNKYVSNISKHKKIISFYQIKKKNQKKADVIPIFSELVADFDKKGNFYPRHVELLSQLEDLPMSLLNSMSRLLIALKANNKGWVQRAYDDILKKNHQTLLFDIEPSFFHSDAQNRRFLERLGGFKEIIEDNLGDDVLSDMLVRSMDELLPIFIEATSSVKWSLQEIRALASNQKYGGRYPWFWFARLYSRSNEVEAATFLKEILSENYLRREGELIIPVYEYYFPAGKKERKLAFKMIKKLLKSKNAYDQYLILQLLKNKIIKRELTKKNKRFRRTIVTLERSYYRGLIRKGIAINFSLYNLFNLGDFDEELLWWIVL